MVEAGGGVVEAGGGVVEDGGGTVEPAGGWQFGGVPVYGAGQVVGIVVPGGGAVVVSAKSAVGSAWVITWASSVGLYCLYVETAVVDMSVPTIANGNATTAIFIAIGNLLSQFIFIPLFYRVYGYL